MEQFDPRGGTSLHHAEDCNQAEVSLTSTSHDLPAEAKALQFVPLCKLAMEYLMTRRAIGTQKTVCIYLFLLHWRKQDNALIRIGNPKPAHGRIFENYIPGGEVNPCGMSRA
jgi:hypothetical protein